MKGKAIVIALLLLAAGVAVYWYVLRPQVDICPVPDGWEQTRETSLEGGGVGASYTCSGAGDKTLAAFQDGLEGAGWTHVAGSLQDDLYAEFARGAERAMVFAVGDESDVTVYVMVSDSPAAKETEGSEIPIGEVDGEDLVDVPRYPGSVRTSYEVCAEECLIEYVALAGVQDVSTFYADKLPEGGWVVQAMTMDETSAEIVGTKIGRGILTVGISADGSSARESLIAVSVVQLD